MKKLIIFLVLLNFVSFKVVKADVLDLELNPNYNFTLTKKYLGTIKQKMYKITKDGKPYYNVQPDVSMFERKNYTKGNILLDFNTYQKMTKIMYYGYGYQNHTTDAFYFATQYLLYEALNEYSVDIVNKNSDSSEFAKYEIEEVRKTIKENKIPNYIIYNNYLDITDKHLIDNFDFVNDDIKIKKIESGYRVEFLNEKDLYQVKLKAKNNCMPADYWIANESANVLGYNGICENDSILYVKREYPKIIDEMKVTEENYNNTEFFIEDKIEVEMPSTAKYNFNWLIILLLLGNIFYVYKK